MPASTAKASVPSKESTRKMPAKATARTTSAVIAQSFRDQRSATAPNRGPSNIAGSRSAIKMKLMAHADSKRS
jgi:hypothetical protein